MKLSGCTAPTASASHCNCKAQELGEALHKAVESGKINEVTRLLGKKADINYMHRWMAQGKQHAQAPLMEAVRGGHAEVAKFLITRKANVNLTEPCDGHTALHCASRKGNVAMIDLLMSKGAKHDVRDKRGRTPLHHAAERDHKDALAYLLDHGADLNHVDHEGWTSLMMAANKNHLQIVNLLLLRGANPNIVNKSSGISALHEAAFNGHFEIAQCLVDRGADVNAADNNGWSPLMWAAQERHISVVNLLLLRGADPNLVGQRGGNYNEPALSDAASNGNLEVVKHLVAGGADAIFIGKSGKTPMQMAAGKGHVEIVEFLTLAIDRDLAKLREDIESARSESVVVRLLGKNENRYGLTHLHRAAASGHMETVTCLLDHGADVNAMNYEGWTALMLAVHHCYLPVVNLLLLRGADPDLVAKDIEISDLKNSGADDRPRTSTPLQNAAYMGHLAIAQRLVDGGADLNRSDKDGLTPLTLSAIEGRLEVLKFLVDEGADLNLADKEGCTTLHAAAILGHFDIVKFLVLKGADMKMDAKGWTPLDAAVFKGQRHVADFLAKAGSRFEEFGSSSRKCKACGKIDMKMCLCKGCDSAFYCNEECATTDWYQIQTGHRSNCRKMRERRERYIKRVMGEAEEKVKLFKKG